MRNKTTSNKNVWAQTIHENVKMKDVITHYWMRTDSNKGRVPCPFHNGQHKNLSYNEETFRCFVCDTTGNVISFVAKLFGLTNTEAMKKIDSDFGLGVTGENIPLRVKRKARELADKRRQRETLLEAIKSKYSKKASLFRYLHKVINLHKPISEDEATWHPVFVYAAQNLTKLEYELDYLMEEMDARSN